MASTLAPEKRCSAEVHPAYWALLGGTVASAVSALYPSESQVVLAIMTAFAFGGYAVLLSTVAKPKWYIASLGFVPLIGITFAPFAVIRSARALPYFDVLASDDSLRLIVAAIAIGLFFTLGLYLTSAKRVDKAKKEWPQKEAFQTAKLKKVRDAAIDPKEVSDRLSNMINYGAGRVDYYEDLRNRYLTIGLGLITGATAISGFLLRFVGQIPVATAFFFGISALCLLATGVWLIHYYNRTASPMYVYRAVADIRSWYYFYNPKSTSKVLSNDATIAETQLETVQSNFNGFLDRWIEWAKDPKAFIAEDLEQVFILQFIQGYKADAVKVMQKRLVIGVNTFAISIAFAIVSWLIAVVWGG